MNRKSTTSIDNNQPSDNACAKCARCKANRDEGDTPPDSTQRPMAYWSDMEDPDDQPEFAFQYSKDALPVWADGIARFRVGSTEYQLSPAPQRPDEAMVLVMDMLTLMQMHSERWLPLLTESGGPVVYTPHLGPSCVLNLSEDDTISHISVDHEDGTLVFEFPPIKQWKDAGIDWMLNVECPCGYVDCHPAPWRRTRCPFWAW